MNATSNYKFANSTCNYIRTYSQDEDLIYKAVICAQPFQEPLNFLKAFGNLSFLGEQFL